MNRIIRSQLSRLALVSSVVVLSACGGGESTSSASGNISTTSSVNAVITSDTPFVYIERDVSISVEQTEQKLSKSLASGEKSPLDLFSPYEFNPGAKLVLRTSLDVDAVEEDVLEGYFGSSEYDVKDLNVSEDGKTLLFAAHGPLSHSSDNSWNIYEYSFETGEIRRIIEDDAVANKGQDTSPAYADGLIVFSTDRGAGNPNSPVDNIVDEDQAENCYKAGPNERPSLLHSMSFEGEDILQLTYGSHHDTKTTAMKDGRVSFLRWSRSYEVLPQCEESSPVTLSKTSFSQVFEPSAYPVGINEPQAWSKGDLCGYTIETPFGPALATNHYTLLRISADGTDLQQLYDTVSTDSSDESMLMLEEIIQAESGQLMVLLAHRYNQFLGGNVMELMQPGTESDNVVFSNLSPKPKISDEVALYPNQLSEAGWFSAVAPYRDGTSRLLVSWSQCTTVDQSGVSSYCKSDGSAESVKNPYGIWVYDPESDSRLPVVRAKTGIEYSELAISQENEGVEYPFIAYNPSFTPNVDDSQVICKDPSYQPTPVPGEPTYPSVTPTAAPTVVPSIMPPATSVPSVTPSTIPTPVSTATPVVPSPVTTPGPVIVSPTPVTSGVPTPAVTPTPEATVEPTALPEPSVEPEPSPPVATPVPSPAVTPTPVATPSPVVSPVPTAEPNTAPVADAGDDQPALIGKELTLDGSASSDMDGDSLTYHWKVLSPANEAGVSALSDPNSVMPKFVASSHETYVIQLIVNDGKEDSAPDTVSLTVGNTLPVADAGDDQSVSPGENVTLDASGSSDLDGDTLSYAWVMVSAPEGSSAQLSGMDQIHPSFVADVVGSYTFALVVNDGLADSKVDTVVVNTVNAVPLANAGPDQSVDVSSSVMLDGSASSDADGDALTFTWSVLSSPEGSSVSFDDADSVKPSINIDVAGSYVLQLIVNDGIVNSQPDTVVVTTANVRPIAEAGINASVKVGAKLILDGSASYDPDGDAISYSWSLISQPSGSNISLNEETSVKPAIVPTQAGTYIAQLIVNDGQLNSAPDTVEITVADEPATCDMSGVNERLFPVVLRDFKASHPDFEYKVRPESGIVKRRLGDDGKPQYAHGNSGTFTTTNEANFNQWYNDVEGVNQTISTSLVMKRTGSSNVWGYSNSSFFPLDDQGWGNYRNFGHNYHFTLETHLVFDYEGGEEFSFSGDDDLYLFVNGVLVVDIGGVHGVMHRSIKLDDLAEELGIEIGQRYSFDLFFAERHTVESNFKFETNIKLKCDE